MFCWLKHCDSKNLLQKIENDTGIHFSNWEGEDVKISDYYGKIIRVLEIVPYSGYFKIHFVYNGIPYSTNSRNRTIYTTLMGKAIFPFDFKLKSYVTSNKNRNKCRA